LPLVLCGELVPELALGAQGKQDSAES